jgi:K+-sensing histidine kinase KdpD
MKSKKSPYNIVLGVVLIALSILMFNFFFGRDEPFFTNTRAGSFVGIAASCLVVFVIGVSRIFVYFWSFLPEIKVDNKTDEE